MKKSYKFRYVRVRVLSSNPTKSGYPVVLDYSNGLEARYKIRTGIFLREVPDKFEGKFTKAHSPDYKALQHTLDDKLDEVNSAIKSFEDTYGRRPSKQELKKELEKPFQQPLKRLASLKDCFDYVYEKKLRDLNPRSAENYKSMAFAIGDFSTRKNKIYTIADIDEAFLEEFMIYLLFAKPLNEKIKIDIDPKHSLNKGGISTFDKNYGMCNNTLLKRMYTFVTILKVYGAKTDTTINLDRIRLQIVSAKKKLNISSYSYLKPAISFTEFKLLNSKKFTAYLQPDTITESYKSKNVEKKVSKDILLRARDLLAVSIAGGCRYSDVVSMTERNLMESTKESVKTRTDFSVINNGFVLSIYKRHNFDFQLSNQRYNKVLKPLLRQFSEFLKKETCDLQEHPYWKFEKRGEYVMEQKINKWEAITSHTGRRSFATIACIEFNSEKAVVRQITGHSSDRMLDTYIQVNHNAGYKQLNTLMDLNIEE